MELLTKSLPTKEKIWIHTKRTWASFSASEKVFLIALFSIGAFNGNLTIAVILTSIGLIMEFWPRFVKCTETIAGKAILLFFYGTITNFALAEAASLVNQVLGINASAVNYTHNFAIVLILPTWFLSITMLTLVFMQLVFPIYLLLLLTLKPFGVKLIKNLSKSQHPIFCNLVRMLMSGVLLYQGAMWLEQSYKNKHTSPDTTKETLQSVVYELEKYANGDNQKTNTSTQSLSSKEPTKITNNQDGPNLAITINDNDVKSISLFDLDYETMAKTALAWFAYTSEADSYSKCVLVEGEKAILLNDYEYLSAIKDKEAEYGFSFKVKKCNSPAFPQ